MKHILALMLAILLIFSLFSACGSHDGADANEESPDAGANDPDAGDDPPDEGNEPGGEAGDSGDAQPDESGLLAIFEQIYAIKPVDFPIATRALDIENASELKYNTGLESAEKISAAALSESMIGAQAFSMAMLRVQDAQDAPDVAEAMKNGINPRKWICVEADDLRVAAFDDLVLLVMIDSEYADIVTADELIEAFGEVCGGEFSADLR